MTSAPPICSLTFHRRDDVALLALMQPVSKHSLAACQSDCMPCEHSTFYHAMSPCAAEHHAARTWPIPLLALLCVDTCVCAYPDAARNSCVHGTCTCQSRRCLAARLFNTRLRSN